MSKLAERIPALANPADRLSFTIDKLGAVVRDGRADIGELQDAIVDGIKDFPVNAQLLEVEGRKAIASQCVSQLTAQRVITIDRKSKTPVYQSDFGFAGNWFKVGSTLVAPEAMTLQDFDLIIERIEHRIENATVDRDVWADFRDRARPGLDAGQNLVEQVEAGTLTLYAAESEPAIEAGAENGNPA